MCTFPPFKLQPVQRDTEIYGLNPRDETMPGSPVGSVVSGCSVLGPQSSKNLLELHVSFGGDGAEP